MAGIKGFLLHKLTLRLVYIVAAFSSAKIITFATSDTVQALLSKAGVVFQVSNPERLKVCMQGLILIGGEFVFRWTHDHFILPHVKDEKK
jgi:hypothetical protein